VWGSMYRRLNETGYCRIRCVEWMRAYHRVLLMNGESPFDQVPVLITCGHVTVVHGYPSISGSAKSPCS